MSWREFDTIKQTVQAREAEALDWFDRLSEPASPRQVEKEGIADGKKYKNLVDYIKGKANTVISLHDSILEPKTGRPWTRFMQDVKAECLDISGKLQRKEIIVKAKCVTIQNEKKNAKGEITKINQVLKQKFHERTLRDDEEIPS